MKRQAWKAFVVLIGVAMALVAGCAGQQASPNIKQSRTLAAENIELKKQLAQQSREIETLKAQQADETNKQKELLAACQKEKEILNNKAQQNIRDQVQSVLDPVMAEYEKLREENSELKAQIEKIQKEAEQNKDANK